MEEDGWIECKEHKQGGQRYAEVWREKNTKPLEN